MTPSISSLMLIMDNQRPPNMEQPNLDQRGMGSGPVTLPPLKEVLGGMQEPPPPRPSSGGHSHYPRAQMDIAPMPQPQRFHEAQSLAPSPRSHQSYPSPPQSYSKPTPYYGPSEQQPQQQPQQHYPPPPSVSPARAPPYHAPYTQPPPQEYMGNYVQRSQHPTGMPNGTGYPMNFDQNGEFADGKQKRRRGNLPKPVTDVLRMWFHEHVAHPYPTEEEKQQLMAQTGLSISQISNWFINARRRSLPQVNKQNQELSNGNSSM